MLPCNMVLMPTATASWSEHRMSTGYAANGLQRKAPYLNGGRAPTPYLPRLRECYHCPRPTGGLLQYCRHPELTTLTPIGNANHVAGWPQPL